MPLALSADRLTPFFLAPSTGGPIEEGAAVSSAAGVAAFESDALSPVELTLVGAAGVLGVSGESFDSELSLESLESLVSLTGTSSSPDTGEMMSRNWVDGTFKVTIRLSLPADLRRPSTDLVDGAMAAKRCRDGVANEQECGVGDGSGGDGWEMM